MSGSVARVQIESAPVFGLRLGPMPLFLQRVRQQDVRVGKLRIQLQRLLSRTDVFADPDGARHAIINSTSDSVHSGFIAQAGHERGGVPQAPAPVAQVQPPVGVTRFRVTFTNPGTYPYICAFHDQLGVAGAVIVLP